MINWQDKGYLLNINKYNENSAIADFFTKNHGKVSGIIFGSTSKKNKSYLIVGNKLHLNFSAKSLNVMGNFKIEIDKINTPFYFDDRIKLLLVIYSMQITRILTVENQSNIDIYKIISKFFFILKSDKFIQEFIFWELNLFKLLGYEINFLEYVDKKIINGKIKYYLKNNLKAVPNFLIEKNLNNVNKSEIISALSISRDFLNKSILNDGNLSIPNSRDDLVSLLNSTNL